MDIESIYYSLAPKTKVTTSCLLLIDLIILVKHMTEFYKCPNDFGPWSSGLYLPGIRCNQSPFSLSYVLKLYWYRLGLLLASLNQTKQKNIFKICTFKNLELFILFYSFLKPVGKCLTSSYQFLEAPNMPWGPNENITIFETNFVHFLLLFYYYLSRKIFFRLESQTIYV